MIISELRVYDFRQFKSVDDAPGLKITFHKGLNALIGENDSGKTAVIDALKLVLLTQSNEYIRPSDEDFYKPVGEDACSEFKIDCTISDFTQNEAKNFIEYLSFNQTENGIEYTLELHYRAWKEGHKIYQELRVGDIDDGISIDGKARELLKAVYLKPLRDAEREMSSGRGSRISQILLNHPVFKDKKEHTVLDIFRDANQRIEDYFIGDTDGKRILQTIRSNLVTFCFTASNTFIASSFRETKKHPTFSKENGKCLTVPYSVFSDFAGSMPAPAAHSVPQCRCSGGSAAIP